MKILLLSTFVASLTFASGNANSAVYLHEGFNGTGLPSGWHSIRIVGIQAAWSVVGQGSNPTVIPYAGPGQAKFNSFEAASGEQARLISPSLNLSASTDPFLTVWMYHEDEYLGSPDSVYVEASTADSISGPWTIIARMRRPMTESRWTKEVISLYQLRSPRVFLSLRGISKYGNNIFIDEFRVADSTFHDISPIEIVDSRPQLTQENQSGHHSAETGSRLTNGHKENQSFSIRFSVNAPLTLGAVVRNFGTFNENTFGVSWRINTQFQTPVTGRPLTARTGRDTLSLTWATPVAGTHTITAWTVLATDSTRSNDTTRLTIQVIDTATVFYESFNGTVFPPTNWLTINRDGGTLAPWFRGADTSAFVPLEGGGFAGNNFQRANARYLDDYLVTPPIGGVGQSGKVDSLIFWVRSKFNPAPAPNFPDSLMVLVSTTGTDTSNFTINLDYFAIPKTGWTRKAYSLTGRVPTNSTVRIAFRYLLFDAGFSGSNGDFIGIDAVQLVRKLPAALDDKIVAPIRFSLEQNYPNPFNPSTTIVYTTGARGFVELSVFDVLGRLVTVLARSVQQAGSHRVQWNANDIPSGVYFYRIVTDKGTQARKMVLMK